ncbi:MAG: dephospho-CoA kinase, partial [Bacteroidota bacterium]
MTTLGITGGIGSGKSAAAARLNTHPGVRVVYADAVAKRLMVEDPAVQDAVRQRFGTDAYREDGTLDRGTLASRVFGSPDELAALNAIVHPAVRRAMLAALEEARASGVRLLVYEAALVFETGADAWLDHVAVVDAPGAVRIERAAARDGSSTEAVRARMDRQMDPAEMRDRADTVHVLHSGLLTGSHASGVRR